MPESRETGGEPHSTFLCFDFGHRRIGVAVGQDVSGTASPLAVLANDATLWGRIEQLLDRWQPVALVVGVPLAEDGSEQPMTAAARRFGRRLAGRFGLPVHEADERFTSRLAQDRFRQRRQAGDARRGDAGREDAVAAQIILEQWLNDEPA